MKTEDGGSDGILQTLSPPSPVNFSISLQNTASAGTSSQAQKRTVCDHCRRRRIRCDGQLPCQPCINASLACKRDHVPLKRGPKRGRGRVINELRERYSLDGATNKHSRESSNDLTNSGHTSTQSTPTLPPPPSDISWQNVSTDPRHAPEPFGIFSSEQYRPTTRSYLPLVPQCIELYYEHVYPIMPLPYMPTLRALVSQSPTLTELTPSERNYLYALCALTCFHMSGQNIVADAPTPSWECAGRFFLDECIAARQSYDFFNDASLHAVISSFWLSTSFFEINQSRKSWVYLREALTLAQELSLHDDAAYSGLDPAESLCRQRVFWQLFVTERSFAILRMKPITLKKTPSLPSTLHPYEAPEIHAGFLQLISSYAPLDESFVNAWNEGSDPRVSITTYLALQNVLSLPPPFLTRPSTGVTSGTETMATSASTPEDSLNGRESIISSPSTTAEHVLPEAQLAPRTELDTDADNEPEPKTTDIQKADLLITQQWLRLIVWQSSFRQQLLSWTAPDESMRFAFPLAIASRTASVLQSLPPQAIEVHGMGIFEKIFEIGTWSMNVLQACDMAGAGTGLNGSGGAMGMDFAGSTDLGVLGVGRVGFSIDPLEFFVRTLSASPNSRKQYAERLLLFASEHPGGMRMSLSPALSAPSSPEFGSSPNLWSRDENPNLNRTAGVVGSVLGEVPENDDSGGHMQQALRHVAAGSAALYGGGEAWNSAAIAINANYGGLGEMLPGPAVFDSYDTSQSGSSSPLENNGNGHNMVTMAFLQNLPQ